MPSTTTIRLSDELKARVAKAAERARASTHSFIVEAIAEKTTAAELRADFYAVAAQRMEKFAQTGLAVPWAEARQYLLDRAAGRAATRPKARKVFAKR